MYRVVLIISLVTGGLLGSWLAYLATPIPAQSFVPDMKGLSTWHVTVIGGLVVNRDL